MIRSVFAVFGGFCLLLIMIGTGVKVADRVTETGETSEAKVQATVKIIVVEEGKQKEASDAPTPMPPAFDETRVCDERPVWRPRWR